MNDAKGIRLYDKWLRNIRRGRRIDSFLLDNMYFDVAIYGMGMIGKQVLDELENTDVCVRFGIDNRASELKHRGIEIVHPSEILKLKSVSVIIVTPFEEYLEIEKKLTNYIDKEKTDIISIHTIVDKLYALELH